MIALFQQISTAIQNAAASILSLTTNVTPKKSAVGTLVDSGLSWSGNNATFAGAVITWGDITITPQGANDDVQFAMVATGSGDCFFSYNGDYLRFSNNIVFFSTGNVTIGGTIDDGYRLGITGTIGLSSYLIFTTGTGTGLSTERWIGANGANSTYYNVPTSTEHIFGVANTNVLQISAAGTNTTGNGVFTAGVNPANPVTVAGLPNVAASVGLIYRVSNEATWGNTLVYSDGTTWLNVLDGTPTT